MHISHILLLKTRLDNVCKIKYLTQICYLETKYKLKKIQFGVLYYIGAINCNMMQNMLVMLQFIL